MPAVKVSDLKIGQEFECDINFVSGGVLFKSAEKISQKHIKALKAWGFTEVNVVDTKSKIQTTDIDNNTFSSDATIDHIFSKCNHEDPVIIELKKISQNLKDSH